MGIKYKYLNTEIQKMVQEGKSYLMIGRILGISPSTVARYAKNEFAIPGLRGITRRTNRDLKVNSLNVKDIDRIKRSIKTGDTLNYHMEIRSDENEGIMISITKKVVVLKKLPHLVIVGYPGEAVSNKTITYKDLAIERYKELKKMKNKRILEV